MIDEYNRTGKEFTQIIKNLKPDVPFIRASKTNDLHFYNLVSSKSYADLDKLSAEYNEMI